MAEPLEGTVVVEAGVAVIGPLASVYLADMGAQVIKIEPPAGDSNRAFRGVGNDLPDVASTPWHVAFNRGKRSLQLDLKTPEATAAVHRLLATADVFLTNFREEGLAHMGLDYETLRQLNPGLVYASSSGYGRRGPDAGAAMLDMAAQARGGLMSVTGPKEEAPYPVGSVIGDTAAALLLAFGVMTALVARERYGVGQRVDTSALGAQLLLQVPELDQTAITGYRLSRQGRFAANVRGLYGTYQTSDGRSLVLGAVRRGDWPDFCDFCGLAELIDHEVWSDPGMRQGFGSDALDVDELRGLVAAGVARRTLSEWLEFLDHHSDIVFGVVQTYDEVLADPQLAANGYLVDVDLDGVGRRTIVGNITHLSVTPGSAKTTIPHAGEHNVEILTELGYSDEEIAELTPQLDARAARMRSKSAGAMTGPTSSTPRE